MEAEKFAHLSVDDLSDGENIRFELTEIQQLADDIRRRGVLQPIVVIPNEDGLGAEVLLGHRRLAAAKLAGLATIPCMLRPRQSEVHRMLDQVAENAQRVNLTPIEEAQCCAELKARGFAPLQIGEQMHKSDTWVIHRLRLLQLPQCVQDAVHERRLTAGRAADLPMDALQTDEQIENLARHLKEPDGISAWWREHYASRPERTARNWEAFKRPHPPKPPPGAKFSLTIHFDAEDTEILEALVRASSVYTKKANVVTALLEAQMGMVRDEMLLGDGWELETLRYYGGMTDAEKDAYDAEQKAMSAAVQAN